MASKTFRQFLEELEAELNIDLRRFFQMNTLHVVCSVLNFLINVGKGIYKIYKWIRRLVCCLKKFKKEINQGLAAYRRISDFVQRENCSELEDDQIAADCSSVEAVLKEARRQISGIPPGGAIPDV